MESNSSGKKPPPPSPINRGPRWSSRIRSYYVNRISTEGRGREKGWMIGWSSRGEILLKDTFGWFARFSTLFIARMWEGWFQEIGFDPWREIWNFNFRLVESRNFSRDDSRSWKKEIFSLIYIFREAIPLSCLLEKSSDDEDDDPEWRNGVAKSIYNLPHRRREWCVKNGGQEERCAPQGGPGKRKTE